MKMPKESMFTFVVEYQGHTLVEQFMSSSYKDAMLVWLANTQAPVVLKEVYDDSYEPALLTGLTNAWCETVLDDNDVFFLINIVLTVKTVDPAT